MCNPGVEQASPTLHVPPHDAASTTAKPYSSSFMSIFSAALYLVVSASMGFFNKALLSVYGFDYPMVVLTYQMATALVLLVALRLVGVMEVSELRLEKARQIAPVAFLYAANVAFGLASLSKLNVPMYNTLKRMTPLVVLVLGVTLDRKKPGANTLTAVVVTVAGCVVAGAGDLSFDLGGYVYAMLSCLLQGGYILNV